MTKRSGVLWFAGVVVLAVGFVLFREKVHFDWATFWQQLKHVSMLHIGIGIALTYATYWLRSVRWAVFVSPTREGFGPGR